MRLLTEGTLGRGANLSGTTVPARGWLTAAVLAVSGDFSGVISVNQYENHVGLFLIFPTSTYALKSELYFKSYRCLNPRMSLLK